jgi:hypothetical protein
MKKFKNEIVYIICNGDSIGINKETYTPVPCCNISCDKCLFYTKKLLCVDALVKWSDEHPWKISDLMKLKLVKNY